MKPAQQARTRESGLQSHISENILAAKEFDFGIHFFFSNGVSREIKLVCLRSYRRIEPSPPYENLHSCFVARDDHRKSTHTKKNNQKRPQQERATPEKHHHHVAQREGKLRRGPEDCVFRHQTSGRK